MSKIDINKGLLFNQTHFDLIIKLYKSTFLDYDGIDDVYKTITEATVKGLNITRASYWEIIDNLNLECKDLYDLKTGKHTIEPNLKPDELPIYFKALKDGIAIVADDALTNQYTKELKNNYLIPLGIKNILDLPIRKEGELIGVFCCEHDKKDSVWSESDLAFARVLCDFLSLMIEQSKRRNIEKELLETERKISLITENSNDGFVVIENSKLTFASPSYCAFLGFTDEEVLNLTIDDIFNNIHKDEFLDIKNYIYENLAAQNKFFKYQFRFKGKNNKYFWREDSVSVLYNKNGEYSKYLIISRDINQVKLAEKKAAKLQSLSKNLNHKLADFTQIVSHNIRSNTSNMTMLLDLIEDTENSVEKEEYFKLLKQSNAKLSETILHLNETLKVQFTPKKSKSLINIKSEINQILNSFESQIGKEKIEIILEIEENLQLNTIPVYFENIISNLLSNAIKYKHSTKKAFIKISVYNENKKTTITVEDNGIGIDLVKNKDKIFGMYKTFHTNTDAIGLGLFMTKSKVNVLGGNILIESKINEGTIFKIIL